VSTLIALGFTWESAAHAVDELLDGVAKSYRSARGGILIERSKRREAERSARLRGVTVK
jgi:hypothetical protein